MMPPPSILRFDRYEVDVQAGRLFKNGLKISLREKSFQVLALLLEHAGQVVTREELRHRLWSDDIFVDFDNNLNITIARLRRALRDSAEHPRFIETVPKRGYRFLVSASEPIPTAQRAPTPRAKIVVLPFLNLSGDPAQEYFSDAMTDEIITALAGLAPEHLAVIARSTSMYYKGRHEDVAHIRRELAVDYLVEGAVCRTEDQVGINIQLVQASTQTHLFAKKYDAPQHGIFDIEKCIAEAIAAHVPETANWIRAGRAPGARVTRRPTEDLVAYTFYVKGRQQVQQLTPDPGTVAARSLRYFEDAIARDPQFALAYAAIAEVYWWGGYVGLWRPKDAFSAGVRAALRAIELDPTLGYPHAMLGVFRGHLDYNWAEAGREMNLALQLDPECPETRFHYASHYLLPQGRIHDAIAELERGLECDPLSLFFRFWLGIALYFGQEYARALEQFQFLIELGPDQHTELKRFLDFGYTGIGLVRAAEGRFDEAVSSLRKALEVSDGLLMRLGQLGSALARSGNTTEARRLLERMEAIAAETYFPPAHVAFVYLGLGDIDAFFNWLERAVDERDYTVVGIKIYPTLEPLRAHPRFTALLRKMNLEP